MCLYECVKKNKRTIGEAEEKEEEGERKIEKGEAEFEEMEEEEKRSKGRRTKKRRKKERRRRSSPQAFLRRSPSSNEGVGGGGGTTEGSEENSNRDLVCVDRLAEWVDGRGCGRTGGRGDVLWALVRNAEETRCECRSGAEERQPREIDSLQRRCHENI